MQLDSSQAILISIRDSINKSIPMSPNTTWDTSAVEICGSCGHPINKDDHKFCPECGQKIDWTGYEGGY